MTNEEIAHAHTSAMYKRLTAQHLSVQDLRAALSQKGLFRTMSQVHADLALFGYTDYAATHSHPQPPAAAAAEQQPQQAAPAPAEAPKPSVPYQSGLGGIAGAYHRAQRNQPH